MLLAILLQLASAPTPYVGSRDVEIDGATYKVKIEESGEVEASPKSFIKYRNMKRFDAMHRAVQAATGCDLTEAMYVGNKVHGKLACGPNRETGPVR